MGSGAIFLLAFGLSMDAFAVSISSGARTKCRLAHNALLMALFFGGFQALMPTAGWAAGYSLRNLIKDYDHWVAFGLLTVLGIKMIVEAFGHPNEEEERKALVLTLRLLVPLSIATSIDALAVGFSLPTLSQNILFPVTIIGLVTFVMAGMGVLIGHHFGRLFGRKFELIGGVILIAIGLKVLLEHLAPLGLGRFI